MKFEIEKNLETRPAQRRDDCRAGPREQFFADFHSAGGRIETRGNCQGFALSIEIERNDNGEVCIGHVSVSGVVGSLFDMGWICSGGAARQRQSVFTRLRCRVWV